MRRLLKIKPPKIKICSVENGGQISETIKSNMVLKFRDLLFAARQRERRWQNRKTYLTVHTVSFTYARNASNGPVRASYLRGAFTNAETLCKTRPRWISDPG